MLIKMNSSDIILLMESLGCVFIPNSLVTTDKLLEFKSKSKRDPWTNTPFETMEIGWVDSEDTWLVYLNRGRGVRPIVFALTSSLISYSRFSPGLSYILQDDDPDNTVLECQKCHAHTSRPFCYHINSGEIYHLKSNKIVVQMKEGGVNLVLGKLEVDSVSSLEVGSVSLHWIDMLGQMFPNCRFRLISSGMIELDHRHGIYNYLDLPPCSRVTPDLSRVELHVYTGS